MIWSFHPEAERELLDAIDYYEAKAPGLGRDFAVETYAAVTRMLEFPNAWPRLDEDVRRVLMNRFPFGLLYGVRGDSCRVLAVMNLHRDPDYWRERLR